jgi:hypothetical protein
MGEAHGAWEPDADLLHQTVEVLRASQSHSNDTQTRVQEVSTPYSRPTRVDTTTALTTPTATTHPPSRMASVAFHGTTCAKAHRVYIACSLRHYGSTTRTQSSTGECVGRE